MFGFLIWFILGKVIPGECSGDTPLAWASWHHRPGKILSLLCYREHSIHPDRVKRTISDHGAGWGDGMEIYLGGKVHL
jgi:uncharacterized protein